MPTPVFPKSRLRINLSLKRRGSTDHPWSTTLWLDTPIPDLTTFEDLCDAINGGAADILPCFYSDVKLTGFVYYPPNSNVGTYTKTVSAAGTRVHSDDTQLTSDSVALVRWSTDARTVKNHPIYLFNYLHGARGRDGTDGDLLNTDQKAGIGVFVGYWIAGVTVNGHTFKRCDRNGAVAQDVTVEDYVHHRDFVK